MRTTLLLVLLTACASSSTFQTADVLGPGGWEIGADASAAVLTGGGGELPLVAMPRFVARVGVGKRVDLGGSVGLDGFRFHPKFQLTQPDAPLIVSVSPGLRVLPLPTPGSAGALVGLEEAVLVGLPFSDAVQAVVVARGAQDVGFVEDRRNLLIWGGGSIGLSWQAAPWVRLMPEAGVMAPFVVVDGGGSDGLSGAVFQLGAGLVFGHRP